MGLLPGLRRVRADVHHQGDGLYYRRASSASSCWACSPGRSGAGCSPPWSAYGGAPPGPALLILLAKTAARCPASPTRTPPRRHQELHRPERQPRPDPAPAGPGRGAAVCPLCRRLGLPALGPAPPGRRPHAYEALAAPAARRRRAPWPPWAPQPAPLAGMEPWTVTNRDRGPTMPRHGTATATATAHSNGAEPMARRQRDRTATNGAAYGGRRSPCRRAPRSGPAAALRAGLAALRGRHPAARPSTLWIGLAIIAGIYVAFYTSLFSNLPGLLTGLFGSVGYWMAQQDVARGGQPWYYYSDCAAL